jgi:3-dehydroquinate dehydratase type I
MDKICVSIFAKNYKECIEVVKKHTLVELRLDQGLLNKRHIRGLTAFGNKIISTCRKGFIPDAQRFEILMSAIKLKTEFVDLEHTIKPKYKNKLISEAIANNTKIISSYHNFKGTPKYKELIKIVRSLNKQSNITKVACNVNNRDDLLNLLNLYRDFEPGKLITIGLGKKGIFTRIAGLFLGAPFTYASLTKKLKTAEGQLDYETIKSIFLGLRYAGL